ncbi:MAG: nucleotidyltransferase [Clostridia bacterium]|nr:nucleotidyltransferase [Clostridia bacterium]
MNKTLVIMAAGLGSRYGGLKQIEPVGPGGEILMDYSVFDAIRAGFSKILLIIKEENHAVFEEHFANKLPQGVELCFVYQKLEALPAGFSVPQGRTKPFGTGHAVLCCKEAIDSPFAVINADDFYGADAFLQLSRWMDTLKEGETEFSMVGYELRNTLTENGTVSRGVCVKNEKNELVSVTERTKILRREEGCAYFEEESWHPIDENSTVSMNCWGFTPAFLPELEAGFTAFLQNPANDPLKAEYYLPSAVSRMIDEKLCRVTVLETGEKWIGVTYQEDRDGVRAAIREKIAAGEYPAPLF